MIKTKICDLLGIEYPIFQGGMAWVANASLASAVSNAGGLGIIAGMNSNVEQLSAEVNKLRTMTDKPFAVNVMLMSPYVEEVAQAVIDLKVPVVTTGAGNASKYMKAWIDAGIKVIPVVPSTALAKMAERSGATAVIAEGCESGGHVGELTTMTLVPQVYDVVSVPVIAAGGIADGRGVAASFMLGACGVQLGTRFLVAAECTIDQAYKDKILNAKDIDTVVTGKRLGHPVRGLKNNLTREFLRMEYDSTITNEEIENFGTGAVRRAVEGDVKNGSLLSGQCASMVKKEQTCREMIVEIFIETEEILRSTSKWF